MYRRAKFFLIIFAIVFINFLTLDFLLIDVEKTALIVAIGIDKTSEGYEVTAQIAVPEATNQSTKSNESVIYASGQTLYDAVNDIGSRTGWYPKLSFCNLIILGSKVFEENVMGVVDFFVRSYKVEDSAILCASENTAKEILLSISPLDNISSFALTKIFVRDHNNASKILTTSIKDFAKSYYSPCKSGFMPMIKMIETEDKGNNTTQTSSLTSNSGASESGGKATPVVYDAETCLLFSSGYKTGEISEDECLFYSLFEKSVNEAFFNLEIVDEEGNFGKALIGIKRVNSSLKLTYEKGVPTLKGNLKLWLQILDTDFPQSMKQIATIGRLSDNMLKKSSSYAVKTLNALFEKSIMAGCDIFESKNMLYRFYNDKFERENKDFLSKLKCNFTVTCQNYI